MGKPNKIDGIFDYLVPYNGNVTIGIFDANENVVQLLFKDISHTKGKCKLYFLFKTQKLSQGTYYARMMINGELQDEMKIEF